MSNRNRNRTHATGTGAPMSTEQTQQPEQTATDIDTTKAEQLTGEGVATDVTGKINTGDNIDGAPSAEDLAAAEADRLQKEQAEQARLQAEQEEADRLQREQAEADRLAAEQAEQKRVADELAASEQAKKDAAASSLFTPVDTPVVAQLKASLDSYVDKMQINKMQTTQTLNINQRGLHRVYSSWMGLSEGTDFIAFSQYLLDVVTKNRAGVFSPLYSCRGFQEISMDLKQRQYLIALNGLLFSVTDPDRRVAKAGMGDVQSQLRKHCSDDQMVRLQQYLIARLGG